MKIRFGHKLQYSGNLFSQASGTLKPSGKGGPKIKVVDIVVALRGVFTSV